MVALFSLAKLGGDGGTQRDRARAGMEAQSHSKLSEGGLR